MRARFASSPVIPGVEVTSRRDRSRFGALSAGSHGRGARRHVECDHHSGEPQRRHFMRLSRSEIGSSRRASKEAVPREQATPATLLRAH